MTKRQDLYLQRRSRSEQSDQRQPNQAKNISHQPRASPNSTPLTSRIEFPTMTGRVSVWPTPEVVPSDEPPLSCPRILGPQNIHSPRVRTHKLSPCPLCSDSDHQRAAATNDAIGHKQT